MFIIDSRFAHTSSHALQEFALRRDHLHQVVPGLNERLSTFILQLGAQRIYNAGARPQRLLWASTGTKDPSASDILYVKGLAAPFTVNTMPEKTLKALATHNELGSILAAGGGDCEEVLAEFAKAGVDVDALGTQLQNEGAKSFVTSWNDLMQVIASKSEHLKRVA